ncbi:hypothetical protein PIB30_075851 [Stylosanthes scabra]|uniref:Uncharacterized protein n=1 Tax=Stylosanthes scabra TaxID=79078 RepID=A0ABU6TRH9_9FABA|nr:hypothetical protein [Stylosanthes scabra]
MQLLLSCPSPATSWSSCISSPHGVEMSSWWMILFWIVYFVFSCWFSYLVFKAAGRHLVVPQFSFYVECLLSCVVYAYADCIIFPIIIPAPIPKNDVHNLASITALFVLILSLPKPPRRFLLFFYSIFMSRVLPLMLVNLWLCFVGCGLSLLPFILQFFLDATTPEVEVVVEEASPPQSNSEDLYQVMINELASMPPYSNNDQPLVVIEVELASQLQSNSESHQPPQVTEIPFTTI